MYKVFILKEHVEMVMSKMYAYQGQDDTMLTILYVHIKLLTNTLQVLKSYFLHQ